MRIAIDIDGVIANLLKEAIRTWGAPRVPYAYSLEEMFPMVPAKEIDKWIQEPLTYRHLEPIDGAKEAVDALSGSGWRVFYVTHRPLTTKVETLTWLRSYGFDAPVRHTDKVDFVQGFDVAVEDCLSIAIQLSGICKTYLMDWSYNSGPCGDAVRVHSWGEILDDLGVKCAKYRSGGGRPTH